MPRYTPELVASARRDYENTDKTLARIALDHEVSERTLNRWRDRDGWARRSERVRDVPTAMLALQGATALLTAQATVPESQDQGEAAAARCGLSAIERIEKLVAQELAAEEASRAALGPLARNRAEAERCARTLSILTQTLHALARLRGGVAPDRETEHDDIPADIDEFRRDLARRIEAFLESREADGSADGDPGPATPVQIR